VAATTASPRGQAGGMGRDSEVVCSEHLATDAGTTTPSTSQPAHLMHHTDGPARLLRHHGLTSTIWGGWTRAWCTHGGVLSWAACECGHRRGCSQLIVRQSRADRCLVRQSRADRCLVESLATDVAVPMDMWCSAARVACVCVASLQSPAVRGSGVRDGAGLCIPPRRAVSFGRSIVWLPYVGIPDLICGHT
jgi:hypothetical protein